MASLPQLHIPFKNWSVDIGKGQNEQWKDKINWLELERWASSLDVDTFSWSAGVTEVMVG